MDIAFIHPTAPFSEGRGASHSASQILFGLHDRGHNITVYCNNTEPLEELPFETKVLDYREGFPRNHKEELNKELVNNISELSNFDIVHSYLMHTIPAMIKISANTSVIVTLNAYNGICPKNNLRFMEMSNCEKNGYIRCAGCTLHEGLQTPPSSGNNAFKKVAERLYNPVKRLRELNLIKKGEEDICKIDGFQALSSHIRSTYSKFGFPDEKISVIPNILDEDFCVPHTSTFEAPFQLLYVGYLKPEKGVERLPRLLHRLRDNYNKQVTLTIVGKGESLADLKSSAKQLGVYEYIDFKGHVDYKEMPQIYASHDIFIYPGIWEEPFGRVFLEALAAGTPIVATDVGGADEIVSNSGRISENNIENITAKTLEILDSDTLSDMSIKAKQRAKKYKKTNLIDEFERLYISVVGRDR